MKITEARERIHGLEVELAKTKQSLFEQAKKATFLEETNMRLIGLLEKAMGKR